MGLRRLRNMGIAFGALIFAGSVEAALVAGQIDTFQDGTTQNWTNGGAGGPPVVNIPNGGPAGANDRFIEVTSIGGNGGGSHLTTFNRVQWVGDYIGQGVTAIDMDLENLGLVPLSIRLAFKSPGGAGYLSAPFPLTAGSGWQHAVFSMIPANMIAVGGPPSFDSFFTNGIAEARIINETGSTNLMGDAVAAQLGVDNIHAVPEPSAAFLISLGLAFTLLLRQRVRPSDMLKG